MRFSVCIPNFNYGRYLGEAIRSVLAQGGDDIEVCISDNASTDDSADVVKALNDPRITFRVNPTNVGFSANLDRAAGLATGDILLMLSADDRLLEGSLDLYRRAWSLVDPETSVVGGSIRVIDSDGRRLGKVGGQTWGPGDRDRTLEEVIGVPAYSAPAHEILRRGLRTLRNPLRFATTTYPQTLYERVGGYRGQQLINPDKWFNFRLLSEANRVYFLDTELSAYRWHSGNQTSQQRESGALKFLMDEYAITFQLPSEVLDVAGLRRDDVAQAFVHNDIGLRGLRALAHDDRQLARRSVRFAQAAYPAITTRSWLVWLLRSALTLGPVGSALARLAYDPAVRVWRKNRGGGDDPQGINATWAADET